MSNYEHCCECDERTGRAGASDDSLYLGSIGPFCEDCVNTWPDKVAQENSKLQYRNRELESRVAELENLPQRFEPCSHCDGDGTYYGLSYDGDPYSCKCPKCDGTGIEL